MKKSTLAAALALVAIGMPVYGQEPAGAGTSIKAADLPNPPVIMGDVSDRPYHVIGQITAGVRKATLFSKAASQEKIFRELWERGKKMGADAVVHASYGDSHVSALSWGQTNATGVAIKFDDVSGASK
jgi:uncharacterized protein YbjQ (UPF0145 family)